MLQHDTAYTDRLRRHSRGDVEWACAAVVKGPYPAVTSPIGQPERLKFGATLQGMGRKVTTPLEYPAHLDMHSYLSSTVLKQRYAMRGPVVEPAGESGDGPPAGKHSLYELYAVVCHKGNIQVTLA